MKSLLEASCWGAGAARPRVAAARTVAAENFMVEAEKKKLVKG